MTITNVWLWRVDYGPDRQPGFLWGFALGGRSINLTNTHTWIENSHLHIRHRSWRMFPQLTRKYGRSFDIRDACCTSLVSTSFCFARWIERNESVALVAAVTAAWSFGPLMVLSFRKMFSITSFIPRILAEEVAPPQFSWVLSRWVSFHDVEACFTQRIEARQP